MNKIMTLLYKDKTKDYIIDLLNRHNMPYTEYEKDNNEYIDYGCYSVEFVNNICTRVLDNI